MFKGYIIYIFQESLMTVNIVNQRGRGHDPDVELIARGEHIGCPCDKICWEWCPHISQLVQELLTLP